jgi:hypothetical protein
MYITYAMWFFARAISHPILLHLRNHRTSADSEPHIEAVKVGTSTQLKFQKIQFIYQLLSIVIDNFLNKFKLRIMYVV